MNKNKDLIIFTITAVLIITAVWFLKIKFAPTTASVIDKRMQVTTSFYPIYFFASQIGGDMVKIVNITPTGVEPHDYEPSPENIIEIESSKLLVLNGGGLEPWADKISRTIAKKNVSIITAGDGLFVQNGAVDPHVWLSPLLAKDMIEKITSGFLQIDPTNEQYYEANKQLMIEKLNNLDNEYKQGLANCSMASIVTSHSAFGHLANTYNLKQVPIAGLSPDAEPSPKQLGSVIQLVRESNIKYIFFESLVSPKLAEMIARETGAKTLVLNPIEGLTPDEIESGKDYFTEMKSNLVNLQVALGCNK